MHFIHSEKQDLQRPAAFLLFLKNNAVILLLLITGFALRVYMAWVDPFLHPWDERFHALVARNMMHSPFKPMLRAFPITNNYDPNMWCCNHIWVHKQPLFMWQMALSMKVFGVSEFTMRLPSVLMGTLMILILYRIVLLFSNNKKIALIAAGLLTLSNFHLQMISGIKGMDHNDVALGFYVLCSIWAYAEYTRSPKWYWVILIGLFAGCAVLNKWLLGLLVFSGWGINILWNFRSKDLLREIRYFVLSLLVCCVVFLPWQIYILNAFPNEARHEFEFNRRHITEALEGHSGGWAYYLKNFPNLFGRYIYLLLFIGGLLSLFFRKGLNKQLHIAFITQITIVFVFFSFIVKTKVDTYFFFVVPLCLAFSAIAIYRFCLLVKRPYFIFPVLGIITFFTLDPIQTKNYLSPNNTERNNRIYNAEIYRNVKNEIPENTKVVMNSNSFEDIDIMFYNNSLTAYHWTMPEIDIKELKEKKIPIAVFEAHGNYIIPEHVQNYPYLFIIKKPLRDF
jgi:4-amino-4-deoxy-L-arabinose transferase-like glycosyltransferase